MQSPLRELFESFREKLIALDPSINEEILKQYIAYKSDSNFATVVSRNNELKIYLSIPFSKIKDSRNVCEDMEEVGHHGTGDTLVKLKSPSDLEYILGLVTQSFEYQVLGEYDEEE